MVIRIEHKGSMPTNEPNTNDDSEANRQAADEQSPRRRRFLKGTGTAVGGAALASIASQSVAADHNSIAMGEDVTFTDMNRERTGREIDDTLLLYRGGSRAESDHNQAWANAEADAGVGTARYFGAVGRRFIPDGDESQEAVVSLRGSIDGYLEGALLGGATVVVILNLVDYTERTNVLAPGRVRIERTGIAGSEHINTQVQTSLETTLQPDHRYTAWAELHARVDLGLEDPGVTVRSDFGGDHEGIEVDDIKITFRE